MQEWITFEAGPGDSIELAVLVRGAETTDAGIRSEYLYVEYKLGAPGQDWVPMAAASQVDSDGRSYDVLLVLLPDRSLKAFHFDISEFYGKPRTEEPLDCGLLGMATINSSKSSTEFLDYRLLTPVAYCYNCRHEDHPPT